jgi:DsbC/DsbD-like thiol-disulfide interchange protein
MRATAAVATALFLLALAGPAPARGAASAWAVNGPSRLRLLSPYLKAPAGSEVRLGIEFRTEPGWHVYWKNSGDAGYPPKVVWSGARIAPGSPPELLWPAPRRFDLAGGLVAFGYEGEVVYPVRARLAAGGGAAHVEADVDYLICQVDCIPFRSRLALDQPLGPAAVPDPATAPAVNSWWGRLPEPVAAVPGAAAELRYDPAGPALTVSLRGVTAGPGADLFLEPQELFDVARPQVRPTPEGVVFRLPLTRQQVNRPLPATAPFAWTATGLRPLNGPHGPLALSGRSDLALAPPAPVAGPATGPTRFSNRGLPADLADLGAALLAGLLLALAPAPLALALSLSGALGARAGRRVAGPAWAAGLACGAWGAAAAARAGAFPGWGAALGNPAWTAGLAALALLAALDLWGLLARPAVPPPMAPAASRRAFLAGLAAPLLALAWPLPAALRIDLSALSSFAAYAAATAVALGLAATGLALTTLVETGARAQGDRAELSATSAATGAALREGLGFLAAAAVLWLLYRLSREARPEGIAAIELALLSAALLAWVRRPLRPGALRRALAAVLLACALAAPFLAAGSGLLGNR